MTAAATDEDALLLGVEFQKEILHVKAMYSDLMRTPKLELHLSKQELIEHMLHVQDKSKQKHSRIISSMYTKELPNPPIIHAVSSKVGLQRTCEDRGSNGSDQIFRRQQPEV